MGPSPRDRKRHGVGIIGRQRQTLILGVRRDLVSGVEPAEGGLSVSARVKTTGQTGVEMEALTAASVACLTLYDMLKAAEKGMVIEAVRLVSKTGGKSGDWTAS